MSHPAHSLSSQDALRRHFEVCQRSLEPIFVLRCWCERLHQTLVPRFGTMLLAATVFIGLATVLA